MNNPIYRCPKGHEVSARFSISVSDEEHTIDLLPYAGDYCLVCFSAFIASHVPRATKVDTERPQLPGG